MMPVREPKEGGSADEYRKFEAPSINAAQQFTRNGTDVEERR